MAARKSSHRPVGTVPCGKQASSWLCRRACNGSAPWRMPSLPLSEHVVRLCNGAVCKGRLGTPIRNLFGNEWMRPGNFRSRVVSTGAGQAAPRPRSNPASRDASFRKLVRQLEHQGEFPINLDETVLRESHMGDAQTSAGPNRKGPRSSEYAFHRPNSARLESIQPGLKRY